MEYKYKYIKKISTGAFSICNLYKRNKRLLAIKKPIDCFEGITYNELREIFSLLFLNNHPNIIQINEVYIDSHNAVNIVYNYYSKTLYELIIETSYIQRQQYLLQFIQQMLSAIYHIHNNGIIHTDIKECNIMISNLTNKEIEIKVIDFGSSYIKNLTDKYSIVSTYTIRAPEIYTYDYNYNNKIDIWSLGVLIYKFITGNDILSPNKHNESTDIDKLKDIYNFIDDLDNINIDIKMKYFLKEMLKIEPNERLDIYNLILLFENIFKMNVPLHDTVYKLENLQITSINSNLSSLNKYISSRLFNIKLNNLHFGTIILNKLDDIKQIDYITIWYLNYQFTHTDVEYILKDFIPIFNSYYKTIFDIIEIHRNCFNILDLIEFNLF